MREIVTLNCTGCSRGNYTTMKNKKLKPERMEYKKYCRFCRSHQPHREKK